MEKFQPWMTFPPASLQSDSSSNHCCQCLCCCHSHQPRSSLLPSLLPLFCLPFVHPNLSVSELLLFAMCLPQFCSAAPPFVPWLSPPQCARRSNACQFLLKNLSMGFFLTKIFRVPPIPFLTQISKIFNKTFF